MLLLLLATLLFATLLFATLLFATLLVAGGGCGSSGGSGRGVALGGLFCFLGLLYLLDDDAMHPNFGQSVGTSAVLPTLFLLQGFDPLVAGQHVAGTFQGILTTETFIN